MLGVVWLLRMTEVQSGGNCEVVYLHSFTNQFGEDTFSFLLYRFSLHTITYPISTNNPTENRSSVESSGTGFSGSSLVMIN
jgi:hypothetical protein